jgi:hypothetical protein
MAESMHADDWLDRALRADGARADAYVADDGFTARVLAGLPQHAALPAWRRPIVVLLWLVAAAAAVVALPDLFYEVFRSLVATAVAQPLTLPRIALALTVLGAMAWSTIVFAVREE